MPPQGSGLHMRKYFSPPQQVKVTESSSSLSFPALLSTVGIPLLVGAVWGVLFNASTIGEYESISSQFKFTHFIMIKTFLSALATSCLAFIFLEHHPSTASTYSATLPYMTTKLNRGLPSLIMGGILIGIAMAVGGTCPGTVFSQLGAGAFTNGSIAIVVGGILGALLYGLLDGLFLGNWKEYEKMGRYKWSEGVLYESLGITHQQLGIGAAILLFTIVGIIEYFVPYQTDVINPARKYVLSPILAGSILGLLQLPLYILSQHHLGSASSYVTVASNTFNFPPWTLSTHMKAQYDQWWQVFLVIGITVGSAIYQYWSGNVFSATVSHTKGLLVGMCLIFGARLCYGCTSGHGISGISYWSIKSIIATAAMFASGIVTAQLIA